MKEKLKIKHKKQLQQLKLQLSVFTALKN